MKEKTQERLHSFHKINITNYTDSRQEKKGENRKLNTNYERSPYFDKSSWVLRSRIIVHCLLKRITGEPPNLLDWLDPTTKLGLPPTSTPGALGG